MRRTGWSSKKASYKNRLIGAGKSGKLSGYPMDARETKAYWQSGGDLRRGRSHHLPEGHAPSGPTERFAHGLAQPGDYEALRAWRAEGGGPSWLPDQSEMGWDTAAIMSQVNLSPRNWRDVQFVFERDGSATMTITSKRGSKTTLKLPDRESAHEVGRMIQGWKYPGITVEATTVDGGTGSGNIGGKARIAA